MPTPHGFRITRSGEGQVSGERRANVGRTQAKRQPRPRLPVHHGSPRLASLHFARQRYWYCTCTRLTLNQSSSPVALRGISPDTLGGHSDSSPVEPRLRLTNIPQRGPSPGGQPDRALGKRGQLPDLLPAHARLSSRHCRAHRNH
jgi:hypothetical protein